MKKEYILTGTVLLVILSLIGLSGCAVPGKVTGGGYLDSQACLGCDDDDLDNCGKANFGFNASSCDDEEYISGHFNYHDKNALYWPDGGVKMNGTIKEAAECVDPDLADSEVECVFCNTMLKTLLGNDSDGLGNVYAVTVSYRSTNPKIPGEGEAVACVVDNGEGINAESADMAVVKVTSGPFAGYFNYGPVQGNIQAHECEE